MPTTVRGLTFDEQAELSELLLSIHSHTDGCAQCQQSMDGKCLAGAELNRKWHEWLSRPGVVEATR